MYRANLSHQIHHLSCCLIATGNNSGSVNPVRAIDCISRLYVVAELLCHVIEVVAGINISGRFTPAIYVTSDHQSVYLYTHS